MVLAPRHGRRTSGHLQVDSSLNMSGEPEVEIGNVAASTNFGVHR